jgi:CBS domain-containing protein/sporulation protein YlmC with PRC-barrel domain
MVFVSDLIDKPVADLSGEGIGTLVDLIASVSKQVPHPLIKAIVVKQKGGEIFAPITDVIVLVAPAISLSKQVDDIFPYEPGEDDIYLSRDVLDKQIIDTNGVRVVRVNDIELTRVDDSFYVANVDIGGLGLLRRMGLAKRVQRFALRFNKTIPGSVIAWDHVELLHSEQHMRLKFPKEKIAELHPADLAEIISDLNRLQGEELMEILDVKTLADTLENVEPDFQASLIENLSDEKMADVLEVMSPDEAADLLAELPKGRSRDLLELMEDDDAEDVRKLLTYSEDSAGGIMTTEYVALPPNVSAEEAIRILRETSSEAETIFYLYVTDDEDHLLGVFSLSDLILAQPKTKITNFMHTKVVKVNLIDTQEKVAQLIAKYDLLAIPVVDNENKLHGIVTSDDALDKIIPTAWKKRLPHFYR